MHFFTDLYPVSQTLLLRSGTPEELIWSPPTDIYETDQVYVVIMEVAGVARETMRISFLHDMLTVTGERSDETRPEPVRYSQMEINYGPFQKEIHFPNRIDRSAISAHYREGFLKVVLPKQR
jgi:HSP20 family protein